MSTASGPYDDEMDAPATARTRAFYDTVADSYARILPDTRAEAPLDLGVIDHFIASLPASGSPVLDAGCGTGRMLGHLAARGVANRVGVDLSPGMIAHARAAHPDTPLEVGDLRSLPFADASLRGVLCWYAIIHSAQEEVQDIAREFARVLEPGGALVMAFQSGVGERIIERAYGHDVTLRGVLHQTGQLADILTGMGFDILATADRRPAGSERSSQGFVIARRA